ncbi:MAG: DNA topoisomerase VI subunit B [Myxococcota bacterium]
MADSSQQRLPFEAAARAKAATAASPPRAGRRGGGRKDRPGRRKPSSGAEEHPSSAPGGRVSAESLASGQREISVSEFFAKNRHLLGFDNPAKALLTTVKELVDNALDAADEARIPADIDLRIEMRAEDRFRVTCSDNGPGIVRRNLPNVFGKLLYGSKFHRLKMSRGQQGIGVSAAGMYGLLTTGRPVRVISRTSPRRKALAIELQIDTRRNQPKVSRSEEVDWNRDHGTEVSIELEATYRKGQHSVDSYLLQVSLANPHATLRYWPPDCEGDEPRCFERVTRILPPETGEIRPHPYGVEVGVLLQMLHETRSRNLSGFLTQEFSRVSPRIAHQICERAGLPPSRRPHALQRAEAVKLHAGIAGTKIMAPPTDCIAPIGEELLMKALAAAGSGDFVTAVTRRPTVYRGNPFLVEAALRYGGSLAADETITAYRFANRVPLQYQQGACAITRAITSIDWKSYGLQQPRGALPVGPMILGVHIASVWVPFTSESKEAIAHYPEIIKEIRLALQDCGRRLATHIRRRRREADEAKKRSYIEKYIPHVAIALQEILGLEDRARERTIETLTGVLERSRKP